MTRSGKVVSTYTKRELTHNQNKQTLTYYSLVWSENVRIISCNHNIQTRITNKLSLTAFDNKQFIHADKITTSPFVHKRLREDRFIREIGRTVDWGGYGVYVVVTSTDNGKEDLAITWIFYTARYGVQSTHTHCSRARTRFGRVRPTKLTKRVRNTSVQCPYLDIEAREESEPEETKPPSGGA